MIIAPLYVLAVVLGIAACYIAERTHIDWEKIFSMFSLRCGGGGGKRENRAWRGERLTSSAKSEENEIYDVEMCENVRYYCFKKVL